MTTSRDRPLTDWTQDEIEQSLRDMSRIVSYAYNDLVAG